MIKIQLPSSKSMFQREIFCAATVARGISIVRFASLCDDSATALRLAANFADIKLNLIENEFDASGYLPENIKFIESHSKFGINGEESFCEINPNHSRLESGNFNCGESGLALHLFASLAAFRKVDGAEIKLLGSGTLLRRKFEDLRNALCQCGFDFKSSDGQLPAVISGKPKEFPTAIDLSNTGGSQALSGMLLANALHAGFDIKISHPKSKNYAAMTAETLGRYGITVENNNFEEYKISNSEPVQSVQTRVEACWSSAAFWFVLGAAAGGIEICGLNENSLQPDRAIVETVSRCGAKITTDRDGNYFVDGAVGELKSFCIDAADFPDLIPNLVILASICSGRSRIYGIKRLKNKESDRGEVLIAEFSKAGISIKKIDENTFEIDGKCAVHSAFICSHGDHRIVIAAKLLEAVSGCKMEIENPDCAVKSWSGFFIDYENYKRNIEKNADNI